LAETERRTVSFEISDVTAELIDTGTTTAIEPFHMSRFTQTGRAK
jgi:hypothetical protein